MKIVLRSLILLGAGGVMLAALAAARDGTSSRPQRSTGRGRAGMKAQRSASWSGRPT
jgi:hypothetical protein